MEEKKYLLEMSGIIENAPYLIAEKYGQRIAGSCNTTGNSNSASHSSNSSSHRKFRKKTRLIFYFSV